MKRRILLVLAIILVLGVTYVVLQNPRVQSGRPVEIPPRAVFQEIASVTHVVDGDTIEIEGGRRVRYIGIDTPELTKCFGSSAKEKNSDLVAGKTVRLVGDVSEKDSYGRLLRYVYVEDMFVNDTLVRQGFARAEPVKPDTLFASQFYAAQTEAKQENRGLWQACQM